MGDALFIVWRESVEALLVIGILHAWLKAQPGGGRALVALWAGVASGITFALVLAWGMLLVQSELAGRALDGFQAAIQLLAAGLIAQMVLWMVRHGRGMRQALTRDADASFSRRGRLGVALIAALAVGREGAECAVFLFGLAARGDGGLWLGAAIGLALALGTAWLLTLGPRLISFALFFRISGILLLLFAGALLVSGLEQLIGMELLPTLVDPLWDSARWLDDSTGLGNLLSTIAGYRARPSLSVVLALGLYWLGVATMWVRQRGAVP